MIFDIFDIFDNAELFQRTSVYSEEINCPVCGMSYNDFRLSGKLGCGECYKTFQKPLYDVLRQIHVNPTHSGKIPRNLLSKLSKKRKLEDLRVKLQTAVNSEDYEQAAKIHKEILEIEKG